MRRSTAAVVLVLALACGSSDPAEQPICDTQCQPLQVSCDEGAQGPVFRFDVSPFYVCPDQLCDSSCDSDCDGLMDQAETALAEGLRPYLLFDDSEDHGEGMAVVYQVTPTAPDQITVAYRLVFDRQSEPEAGACGGAPVASTQGDHETFTVLVQGDAEGLEWTLSQVQIGDEAAADLSFEPAGELCSAHLRLYVAEDVHRLYTSVDSCQAGCNADACGGGGALLAEPGSLLSQASSSESAGFSSPVVPGNIGELPDRGLLPYLDQLGFAGEELGSPRCFCGGLERPFDDDESRTMSGAVPCDQVAPACAAPLAQGFSHSSASCPERVEPRTWPQGDYCVLRMGDGCPVAENGAFLGGIVVIDTDESWNTSYALGAGASTADPLSHARLQLCCGSFERGEGSLGGVTVFAGGRPGQPSCPSDHLPGRVFIDAEDSDFSANGDSSALGSTGAATITPAGNIELPVCTGPAGSTGSLPLGDYCVIAGVDGVCPDDFWSGLLVTDDEDSGNINELNDETGSIEQIGSETRFPICCRSECAGLPAPEQEPQMRASAPAFLRVPRNMAQAPSTSAMIDTAPHATPQNQ